MNPKPLALTQSHLVCIISEPHTSKRTCSLLFGASQSGVPLVAEKANQQRSKLFRGQTIHYLRNGPRSTRQPRFYFIFRRIRQGCPQRLHAFPTRQRQKDEGNNLFQYFSFVTALENELCWLLLNICKAKILIFRVSLFLCEFNPKIPSACLSMQFELFCNRRCLHSPTNSLINLIFN